MPSISRWTFLSNHGHVIVLLGQNPELTVREMAGRIGITERAVIRILGDLEAEGYVQIERVGRKNRYELDLSQTFRHPLEYHCEIGVLLGALTPD